MLRNGTIALALLLGLGSSEALARTWTSASGAVKIEAELIEKRADGTVVLKRADGVAIETKAEKLSPADQQYIRQWTPGGEAAKEAPDNGGEALKTEDAAEKSGSALSPEAAAAIAKLKSADVKTALQAFEEADKKLSAAQAAKQKEYREKLAGMLEEALKETTSAGDLDDALAIRNAVKALKNGQEPPMPTQPVAEASVRKPGKDERIPKKAIFFGGHHYFLVMAPQTKAEAQKKCEEQGGHLVRIDSKAKQAFVQKLVSNVAGDVVWIDGSDAGHEGDWRFSDGRKITSFNWRPGTPDNFGGGQHNIHIRRDGLWDDCGDHEQAPYVCEWDK